ncbi:TetR/AcrR family transcriptional regulator [Oceanobacillus alkalisoli]|uniref:TetR/AcrR family transcriptional regulator n=1 Tax=Oceanobacillus alkalisoli TaxID=2925113 RepID=UPI001EF01B5C|nr:TetR/AcrR family transcriptional regulator [Oceanobacillus alkalisoli]MCF3943596.1 TetR/AcrR family transcriptional regulator [Oceanobacillus alkalisoli]MCG5102861.1 TetR/AcrR family transcriptional regulator [Oceanobacillus alkalisoli]
MEKRKLIMEKALELFAEQGFRETSVQEITERSGISKGAFYLSFKSKDELIMALIHKFLQEFMINIDQLVSEGASDQLLYNFYEYHFDRFLKQSGFAKVFMKEQVHFLDEEFITQISGYNERMRESILTMLEKVYGDKVLENKYDLVYTILGLMKSYMEILLLTDLPFEAKQLAASLVEKTDILAKHMSQPAITEDVYIMLKGPQETILTMERVYAILDETIASLEESVEKESIVMLKNELMNPSLNQAVIKGLLKNIEANPQCKRAAYVFHHYFEQQNKWSVRDES